MTTYNTGNPVPSADARDRYDNSQTFDEVINGGLTYYTNRVGNNVLSFKGMADMFNAAQAARDAEYAAGQAAFEAAQISRATTFQASETQRYDIFQLSEQARAEQFTAWILNTSYALIGDYDSGPLTIELRNQIFAKDGEYWRASPTLELPYTTVQNWAVDLINFVPIGDASIRQELASPTGSTLVGNGDRSVAVALRDVMHSILDAPYNAKVGETINEAAFTAYVNDAKRLGGRWGFPAGKLNIGKARLRALLTEGVFKSFTLEGMGSHLSFLELEDVSPVLSANGLSVVTPEPHIFDFRGVSGVTAGPRCMLKGFTVSYSKQVYKGGASAATPALTDIKPLSMGCNLVNASFMDGIEVEDVVGVDIYGNGIILSRTPYSFIHKCKGFDVSGGNIGAADSFGGFVGIMRGSQTGTLVSKCEARNSRVYKTDTIGGYTNITSKDTPCGYIGFWSEYPTNQDGVSAPGADTWLSATPQNRESFGGAITNCFAQGYVLGFKSEGYTPMAVDSCTAIGCWIPFIGAATRGSMTNCYGDLANLDGKQCPQSGFEYIKALAVVYNVNAPVESSRGFTFEGFKGFTRRTNAFTTNVSGAKFKNFQIVCDADAQLPLLFGSRAAKPLLGVEISGTLIIKGGTASRVADMPDVPDLKIDMNVTNLSDFHYSFRFGTSGVAARDSIGQKLNFVTEGLVNIAAIGNNRGLEVDAVQTLLDTSKSFPNDGAATSRFIQISAEAARLKSRISTHSSACSGFLGLGSFTSDNGEFEVVAALSDSGSSTVETLIFFAGRNVSINRAVKTTDAYMTPLVTPGVQARGWHLNQAATVGDAPLVNNAYSLIGPISLGPLIRGAATFKNALNPSEPNAATAWVPGTNFPEGLKVDFLNPVAGGKQGLRVFNAGMYGAAWVASAAVTVGTIRSANGQVYSATVAGTTGTVAPTHTSGTAVDGTVTWQWIGKRIVRYDYGTYGTVAL